MTEDTDVQVERIIDFLATCGHALIEEGVYALIATADEKQFRQGIAAAITGKSPLDPDRIGQVVRVYGTDERLDRIIALLGIILGRLGGPPT